MPLKQCTNKDGIKGWSWGNGPCLTGKDAKKKAIKMGLAIEGPDKFAQKACEQDLEIDESDIDIVIDEMYERNYSTMAVAAVVLVLIEHARKADRFVYEDPKTGEQYTYRKEGNYRKDGRNLVYIGKANGLQ